MTEVKVKKTGHRFQAGNPGGPGRPKLSDPKLADFSRNLTKTAIIAMLSQMLDAGEDELELVLKDRSVPAIKKAIAAVIMQCIKNGDYMRLEMLLNRTIGKVKDEALIETKNHDAALESVPREKIVELLRAANE